MKIICIEEHTMDGAIVKSAASRLKAEAPYMQDLGSQAGSQANRSKGNRPKLDGFKDFPERLKDLGQGRISDMDEHGISMQILSYSSPTQLTPENEALDLAKRANDQLAEAVVAHPNRFQGFATLPWQKPDLAAQELERAVKELGLKGTLIIGRPGESFLDDPCYEVVLAKLDELRVPLYVHPGAPLPQVQQLYYAGFEKTLTARLSLFGWGWHNEAGIQVVRMILSGKLDKFPKLNLISGHWGEMVPFYLQRLDDSLPQEVSGLKRTITDTYRAQVYVTPSGMLNLPHFEFIHKVIGIDRLIYSIDYPYLTQDGARDFLIALTISEDDREKFAFKNAEKLFKL